MISAAMLTSRSFSFCYEGDRSIRSPAYFLPNGLIVGPRLQEVHRWHLIDGFLTIKDTEDRTTGRLNEVALAPTDTLEISGTFLKRVAGGEIRETTCQFVAVDPELADQRVQLGCSNTVPGDKLAAVLIRTHILDDKVMDLLALLERSKQFFDVFIVYDRGNGQPETNLGNLIWHSATECSSLGLSDNHERLLWWCGDYPFYFAIQNKPGYNYYIMIEYDVHFTSGTADLLERLIPLMLSQRLDAIGTRLRVEEKRQEDGLHYAAFARYETVYSYFFPFIVLSRPALHYLYSLRREEKACETSSGNILYCESFVPTALISAGFKCVDLNEVLPGSYRNDLMIMPNRTLGLPLSLGAQFANFSEIIHPVYSDDEYLRRVLSGCAVVPAIKVFISQLDAGDFGSVASDTHGRYKKLAEEKLLVAPNVTIDAPSAPDPVLFEIGKWYASVDPRLTQIYTKGWSVPERWGVWGVGSCHQLDFVVPSIIEETLLIDLDIDGFTWNEFIGRSVDLILNGVLMEEIVLCHQTGRSTITLRTEALQQAGHVVSLEFRPHQVVVPKNVLASSSDDRPLGVALHHIRLRAG